MNLHDVYPAVITRLVWFYPYGRNGMIAGRGQVAHLYRIERETPPPMDAPPRPWRTHHDRWYWRPFTTYPDDRALRQPLCGPLRTAARHVRAGNANIGNQGGCRDCLAAAHGQPIANLGQLQAQDPWNMIPAGQRETTPDPLTGR